MPRYYVEHDGRVLIARDEEGGITLPTDVNVPFDEATRRILRGTEVIFGNAHLKEHPMDWPSKDELAHDPDAGPLLRAAINASLFRPVVGVVVQDEDEVLLVEPARGVAQGRWTLPGGFVNFFEDPEEAARREVMEETGLELTGLSLVGTVTYTHRRSPYPILGLGYTARARTREVTVREEEISRAAWMDPRDAFEDAGGIARAVLGRLEGFDDVA